MVFSSVSIPISTFTRSFHVTPKIPIRSHQYFQSRAKQLQELKQQIQQTEQENRQPAVLHRHKQTIQSIQQAPLQQAKLQLSKELEEKIDSQLSSESTTAELLEEQESLQSTQNASTPHQADTFAIVSYRGNQMKVSVGDLVMVDRMREDIGSSLTLSEVMLLGSRDFTIIGAPVINNASVRITVEEQTRTKKILVFHKLRRKHHKKMQGYR